MTATERMYQITYDKGLSVKELAAYLGVTPSVIAGWKKTNDIPPARYLEKISDFLNITIDHLVTGRGSGNEKLLPDEETLLTIFRQVDNKGKTLILARAYDEEERAKLDFAKKESSIS